MNDELNLEPYRQAWKAEKERLQTSPPRHTEKDIAAMLTPHKQRSRTLPIWFGRAAASVAILVGVAWMLWLRPTSEPTDLPTIAELHPKTPISITPTIPASQTATTTLTTPPTIHPQHHTISEFQVSNAAMPNIGGSETLLVSDDNSLSIDVFNNDDAISATQPVVPPTTVTPSAQPQLQAFQESSVTHNIVKQKTPKDPLVRTSPIQNTSSHFQSTQVGLSLGASFTSPKGSQALIGIGVTRDTKSNGIICANSQGALYLLFDLPPITTSGDSLSVSIHYGYGLSCRPTDCVTLRLNLGGYLLFGDFDLGLRLNTEVGYCIAEHLNLNVGYQYYMPGIVSGDSRHAAILSIGYIID